MATKLSLMLLFVCLLCAAPAHAQNSFGDPGYAYVRQSGLGQEFDLTQTQDDLTVSLNYIYADENRISVEYGGAAPLDRELPVVSLKLEDSQGNVYERYAGGGGSGGGTDTMQYVTSMENFRVGENWRDLDGNFTLTMTASDDLIFEFEVNVPIEPAIRVVWDTVVSAGGVNMRFMSSSTSQSMTVITVCYGLATEQAWMPRATMRVLTETAPALPYAGGSLPDDNETCYDLHASLPLPLGSSDPTPIAISIEQLLLPRPRTLENMLELQTRAAELGITVEITDTGDPLEYTYSSSSYATEFTNLVADVFYEHIDGPWRFEIAGLP